MSTCRIRLKSKDALKMKLMQAKSVDLAKQFIRQEAVSFSLDKNLEILKKEDIEQVVNEIYGEVGKTPTAPIYSIIKEVRDNLEDIAYNATQRYDMAVRDKNARIDINFIPCFSVDLASEMERETHNELNTFFIYDMKNLAYTCQNSIMTNVMILKQKYFDQITSYLNIPKIRLYRNGIPNLEYERVMQDAWAEINKLTNNFRDKINNRSYTALNEFIRAFYVLNNFDDCIEKLAKGQIEIQNRTMRGCSYLSDDRYAVTTQRIGQQDFDESNMDARKNNSRLYQTIISSIEYGDSHFLSNADLDFVRQQVNKSIETSANGVAGIVSVVQIGDEVYPISDILSMSPYSMNKFTQEQRTLAILECIKDTGRPSTNAFREFWLGVLAADRQLNKNRMSVSLKADFSRLYNLQNLLFTDIVTNRRVSLLASDENGCRVKGAADVGTNVNQFKQQLVATFQLNGASDLYKPSFRFANGKTLSEMNYIADSPAVKQQIEQGWGINLDLYDALSDVPGLRDFLRNSAAEVLAGRRRGESIEKSIDNFISNNKEAYAKVTSTMRDDSHINKINDTDYNGNSIPTSSSANASKNFVLYRDEFARDFGEDGDFNIFINKKYGRMFLNGGQEGNNMFSGILSVRSEVKRKDEVVKNKDLTDNELLTLSVNDEFLKSILYNRMVFTQPAAVSDKSIPTVVNTYLKTTGSVTDSLVYQTNKTIREFAENLFRTYHAKQLDYFLKSWEKIIELDTNQVINVNEDKLQRLDRVIKYMQDTPASQIRKHLKRALAADPRFTFAKGLHYDAAKDGRFIPNMSIIRFFIMSYNKGKYDAYMNRNIEESLKDLKQITIGIADQLSDIEVDNIVQLLNYSDNDPNIGEIRKAIKYVFKNKKPTDKAPNNFVNEVWTRFATKYTLWNNIVREGFQLIMQKDFVYHKTKSQAKTMPTYYEEWVALNGDSSYFNDSLEAYIKEAIGRFETSNKRNNMLSASYQQNMPAVAENGKSEYRPAPNAKVAILPSYKTPYFTFGGDSGIMPPHDGAGWTLGIHSVLENNACIGKDVYGSKKYIATQTSVFGETLYKYADFQIDNAILRAHGNVLPRDVNGFALRQKAIQMMHPCKIPSVVLGREAARNGYVSRALQEFNAINDVKYATLVDYTNPDTGEQKKAWGLFAGFGLNNEGILTVNYSVEENGVRRTVEKTLAYEGEGDQMFYPLDALWEALGGENTYDIPGNFNTGNEASMKIAACFLCEIYPEGREQYIAKIIPEDAVKSYQINLNDDTIITNNGVKDDVLANTRKQDIYAQAAFGENNEFNDLLYMTSDTSKGGMQNDNTHLMEDADVASTTQYFASLSHGGYNIEKVGDVYKGLEMLTLSLNEANEINFNDKNKLRSFLKDLKKAISKEKNISGASLMIDQLLDDINTGKYDPNNIRLPFSDKGFFEVYSKVLILHCNSAIRQRFSGISAIMNPSDGIIGIYEDREGNIYHKQDILKLALESVNGFEKSNDEIIEEFLATDPRFAPQQVVDANELQMEDTVEIQCNSEEELRAVFEKLGTYSYLFNGAIPFNYLEHINKRYIQRDGNNLRICIKDPISLYLIEAFIQDGGSVQKVTSKVGRELRVSNITWTEGDKSKTIWLTTESKNMCIGSILFKEKKINATTKKQMQKQYKFMLFDLHKHRYNGQEITDYKDHAGEQALNRSYASIFGHKNLSMHDVLSAGPQLFAEPLRKALKTHDEVLEIITATEDKNASVIIRPNKQSDVIITDFQDFDAFNNLNIVQRFTEPEVTSDGTYYFPDVDGEVLASGVPANSKCLIYADADGRSIAIVDTSGFNNETQKEEIANVIKSAHGSMILATHASTKDNPYYLSMRLNGRNSILSPRMTDIPRITYKKYNEKLATIKEAHRNRISNVSEQIYSSFIMSNDCMSIRTPSQSWQSGLPARTVVFVEGNLNDVYTNKWEQLFQGSDYDIDKASTLIYSISSTGIIDTHTPLYRKFSKVDELNDVLEFIPWPNKKGIISDSGNVSLEGILSRLLITDLNNLTPKDYGRILDEVNKSNGVYTVSSFVSKLRDLINESVGMELIQDSIVTDGVSLETVMLLNGVANPTNMTQELLDGVINSINEFIAQGVTIYTESNDVLRLANEINRHQKYNPSPNGIKNRIVKLTRSLCEDPLVLDRRQKPMESDLINDEVAKFNNAAVQPVNPDSVLAIPSAQYVACIGREEIGVMASAMKGISNLLFYLNRYYGSDKRSALDDMLRTIPSRRMRFVFEDGTVIEKDIDRLATMNFDFTDLNKCATQLASLSDNDDFITEYLSAVDDDAKKDVLERYLSISDNDIFDIMSVMLSLAADNAKELTLGKMNCTSDTAKGVVALFVLGFTPNEAVRISMELMGKIVKDTNSNRVLGQKKTDIIKYLSEQEKDPKNSNPNIRAFKALFLIGQELTSFSISLGLNLGIKNGTEQLITATDKFWNNVLKNVTSNVLYQRKDTEAVRKQKRDRAIYESFEDGARALYGDAFPEVAQYISEGDFKHFDYEAYESDAPYRASRLTYKLIVLAIAQGRRLMFNIVDAVMSNEKERAYFLAAYKADKNLELSAMYKMKKTADEMGLKLSLNQCENIYDDYIINKVLTNKVGTRYTFSRDAFANTVSRSFGIPVAKTEYLTQLFNLSNNSDLTYFKNAMDLLIKYLKKTYPENNFLKNLVSFSPKNSYSRYRIDLSYVEDNNKLDSVKKQVVDDFRILCSKPSPFQNIDGLYLYLGELLYLYQRVFGSHGMGIVASEMNLVVNEVLPNIINGSSLPNIIMNEIADQDSNVREQDEYLPDELIELLEKVNDFEAAKEGEIESKFDLTEKVLSPVYLQTLDRFTYSNADNGREINNLVYKIFDELDLNNDFEFENICISSAPF